jgi:hypothetical protein
MSKWAQAASQGVGIREMREVVVSGSRRDISAPSGVAISDAHAVTRGKSQTMSQVNEPRDTNNWCLARCFSDIHWQ